jgi:hypothetical protein
MQFETMSLFLQVKHALGFLWVTVPQAGRSQVPFPMVPFEIVIDIIFPATL